MGENNGPITASYAIGNANGGTGNMDNVGGLVGWNTNNTTITASYASGNADGGNGSNDRVGRLVGLHENGTITESYAFGTSSNGEITGHNGSLAPVASTYGLTLANAGTSWNSATGGTAGAWNFGTSSQNPALVYADYDGGGTTHACNKYPSKIPGSSTNLNCGSSLVGNYRYLTEVSLPVDVDQDGLIEIRNLDMLNNIHYNLAGTSYRGSTVGAPVSRPPNCIGRSTTTNLCGYELTRNLDFALSADYASGSVNNSWRPNNANPDGAGNAGFNGFGAATGTTGGFTAIFDGNGHSIKNLYSRASNVGSRNVGLFRLLGSGGVIRNVGVTEANVYGGSGGDDRVGSLVGWNSGTIIASYANGRVDSRMGDHEFVGILVGVNSAGGRITTSYATGSANDGDGNNGYVGGLVGESSGTIIASYATGTADGGSENDDRVGGLVGYNNRGTITASYAIGNADGGDGGYNRVGGLVGYNNGTIIASYARGKADGGDGREDHVGGLVGENTSGTIIASYATGNVDSGAGVYDRVGGLAGTNKSTITASYATGKAVGGTGNYDRVGGLVGWNHGGTITASYATGNADGGAGVSESVGALVGFFQSGTLTESYAFGSRLDGPFTDSRGTPPVTTASGLRASNAGASWNSVGNNTFGAWNFGSSSQKPALVYADYDGTASSATRYRCSDYPPTIPGTTSTTLTCGTTLLRGQR